MVKKAIKNLLIAAALQVVNVSWADRLDREGQDTSGLNDTAATAQNLGIVSNANPLTVLGWVDVNNPNDVDFYQFSVSDPSLTLFFDIDFADDVAQTDDNDLGLDTALWLFDAAGALIAWNDDSDFFEIGTANQGTDPGSDRFGDHDSFIGGLSLLNGTYFVAVPYFGNDASALFQSGIVFTSLSPSGDAIAGATPDTSFENNITVRDCPDPADPAEGCTGPYQLQIRTLFNSTSDDSIQIPEPASFALVSVGLLGMYIRRRLQQTVIG